MTRMLLDTSPSGAQLYYIEFDDARGGRAQLVWEDQTPGDRGRNELSLPASAVDALARVLIARVPQDERLRDEVSNALSELAWQYEQAVERERARPSLVNGCQARPGANAINGLEVVEPDADRREADGRETTIALLTRQVAGAEALSARFERALILPSLEAGRHGA